MEYFRTLLSVTCVHCVVIVYSNGCATSEDMLWKLEALQTFVFDLHWPDEVFAEHISERLKTLSTEMIEAASYRCASQVASICFEHCEGRKSLPSPFFTPLPSPPFTPFTFIFPPLVAFKMYGYKQQKMAIPYIFMKKFSKSYNYFFHSVVTVCEIIPSFLYVMLHCVFRLDKFLNDQDIVYIV